MEMTVFRTKVQRAVSEALGEEYSVELWSDPAGTYDSQGAGKHDAHHIPEFFSKGL